MAKPKSTETESASETPTEEARPKPARHVRALEEKHKDDPPVLIFHRKGGPYKCSGHEPTERDLGTGVKATREFSMVLMPGVNLVARARFEFIKDNPTFRRRVASREIVVSREPWDKIPEGTCIEEIKRSANLPVLADLLEKEDRVPVSQALQAHLEIATRVVRKSNPSLTPVQVARGRGRRG